jgi:ATP-binding cassette subfamily C protein
MTEPPMSNRPLTTAAMALCLALSVALQAALLAVPLLTMHVMDGVLATRSLATLGALAVGFAVAIAMAGLFRHLRVVLLASAAESGAQRLQQRALRVSVRRALRGDRSTGAMVLQDVAELRRFLGGGTLAEMMDLVAMPVALAVLFLLHPLYGWVGVAGCMLLGLLGWLADATTRGALPEASAEAARVSTELAGRLRQRDLVEGLGLLPAIVERWHPRYLRAIGRLDAAQLHVRTLQGFARFATLLFQGGMAAVGAWLVIGQQAAPGSIIAAALLAGMATSPVARLVATWRDWAFARLAWSRLRRLVADPAEEPAGAGTATALAGLSAEGVTVSPPGAGAPLVRDLSLRLAPGEVLAITGRNGAGKTTLLRALLGLVPAESGRVVLDGLDARRTARDAIGPRIGYLPQEAQLLDGSVLDNIRRFGGGTAEQAIAAARQAGAHEAIGRLPEGYATGCGPSQGLSGGQRRLVAFARALFGQPSLLVLDEPEAGLDGRAIEGLRAAVASFRAAGGMVVLVTHQPDAWRGLLDKVLHLEGGGAWRTQPAT